MYLTETVTLSLESSVSVCDTCTIVSLIFLYLAFCDHGSIRLTGLDPLQGHVEVCVNGTWGSLCNDYWHNNDASVVCRQLGFDPEGIACYFKLFTLLSQ